MNLPSVRPASSADAPQEPSRLRGVRVLVLADQPVDGEALAALLSSRDGADAQWVGSMVNARRLLRNDAPTVLLWTTRAVDQEAAHTVTSLWEDRRVGLVMLVDDVDRDSMTELVTHGAQCLAIVRRSATPSVDDLVHALHEVHNGRASIDPDILSSLLVVGDAPATDGLTQAEREVADLVAQGLRNETIGKRLFKSERTVEKHVTNVFDKLGLCPRLHAHLDRRVATARIVLAEKAGGSLAADALDGTPP